VFVGVGHEIDTSVADEVASRAFKTPTACAAGVVDLVNAYVDRSEQVWDSIARLALETVRGAEQFLSDSAHTVRHRVNEIVRVGEHTIVSARTRLRRRPLDIVRSAGRDVDAIAERVRLLDPQTTLARGWSMTKTASGETIRKASQVKAGDEVVTHLVDGTIKSVVKTTTKTKGK
jgi:exodeoxyribonuclease VII large subunit